MRIHLVGKHSNRVPFAYPAYKQLLSQYFVYCDYAHDAEFLVFGFSIDIKDNLQLIEKCKAINPDVKIVVLSEEPLWDTVWDGHFLDKQVFISADKKLNYHYVNHENSSVFDFNEIPYFITTNNSYLARYQALFSRNARLTKSELKAIWDEARFDAAFYAEFRNDPRYAVEFPAQNISGLSNYRTSLAECCSLKNVIRVGQGWSETTKRQHLPDWHLDKLASLDKKCRFVSAIENTHQIKYITEKIFDAFAAVGIPLYYADSTHGIHRVVDQESYINLYGYSVEDADDIIKGFIYNDAFLDSYIFTQNRLAQIFSSFDQIANEMQDFAQRLKSAFEEIKESSITTAISTSS